MMWRTTNTHCRSRLMEDEEFHKYSDSWAVSEEDVCWELWAKKKPIESETFVLTNSPVNHSVHWQLFRELQTNAPLNILFIWQTFPLQSLSVFISKENSDMFSSKKTPQFPRSENFWRSEAEAPTNTLITYVWVTYT